LKKQIFLWRFFLLLLFFCSLILQQGRAQSQNPQKHSPQAADAQEKNVKEYVELLRTDVRQQKSQILGAVMQFDVDQAAKFWPIYNDYDAELTKLNNLRLANIQEYAKHYSDLTDAKADELIQKALDYRKQRADLLAKCYGRVKASLGAVEAARFLQVEDQLLLIIDLQIQSSLPIIAQGS
jgi:hypothetical protein